ncbi:hypothetical protein MRX96_001866 [Rhipicephalus microplus]
MICTDMEPFRVTVPGCKLPSRDDLRKKLLPEKVSALKTKILSSLAGAEYVCIALDVWTSRSMEGFLAIEAKFVDSDFAPHMYLLSFTRQTQRWCSNQICVIRVVTENVSSMIKPFEFAGWETEKYDEDDSFDDHLERIIKDLLSEFHQLEQIRFGCAAHNLQLAAKHSIRLLLPTRAARLSLPSGDPESFVVLHVLSLWLPSAVLNSPRTINSQVYEEHEAYTSIKTLIAASENTSCTKDPGGHEQLQLLAH